MGPGVAICMHVNSHVHAHVHVRVVHQCCHSYLLAVWVFKLTQIAWKLLQVKHASSRLSDPSDSPAEDYEEPGLPHPVRFTYMQIRGSKIIICIMQMVHVGSSRDRRLVVINQALRTEYFGFCTTSTAVEWRNTNLMIDWLLIDWSIDGSINGLIKELIYLGRWHLSYSGSPNTK